MDVEIYGWVHFSIFELQTEPRYVLANRKNNISILRKYMLVFEDISPAGATDTPVLDF